jgi:transposase-like protein
MGEGIQRLGALEELFGRDRLSEALRGRVREMIMALAEAELAEVLAAGSYERSEGRRGYRNGKRQRSISTGLGATVIELPRARIGTGERETEWQSGLIARYQRISRYKNRPSKVNISEIPSPSLYFTPDLRFP